MANVSTVRKKLENCVHYILKRISAKAFLSNHDEQIRNYPQIQNTFGPSLEQSSAVTIVSIGKMADSLAFELVDRFKIPKVQGIVSTAYVSSIPRVAGLQYFQGGHPLPNEQSLVAAETALQHVSQLPANHLVVYLVSGGGSSCFELPDSRLSLGDLRATYSTLISCGADICEVNLIRQQLSVVKGGRLAAASGSKRQISLVVSDVPGNDLQVVSSGPSVVGGNRKTEEIEEVVDKYSLLEKLPRRVAELLMNSDSPLQAPQPQHFSKPICIGSNEDAISAAVEYFEGLGWNCKVDRRFDDKPVEDAARGLLHSLAKLPSELPSCVIAGGEVSSKVVGNGRGGRNQAFVLECVPRIAGNNIAVMSFGTDGIDGNSPSAGAIANGNTFAEGEQVGMNASKFAASSNSFEYFSKLDRTIELGPTHCNVCDVRMLVRIGN